MSKWKKTLIFNIKIMIEFLIFVISIVMLIVLAFTNNKKNKKNEKEFEELIREQKIIIPRRISQYNTMLNELYLKYGKPDVNIYISKYPIYNNIFDLSLNMDETTYELLFGIGGNLPETVIEKSFIVFESSQTIFLGNKPYSFKDIISYEVVDDSKIIYSGNSNSNTSTSNKSMIGRAAVGGVLLGGTGALIGGITANKQSNTSLNISQTTNHKYEVIITLNNLSEPIIKIELEDNRNAMEKISSVLSIIISRNQK